MQATVTRKSLANMALGLTAAAVAIGFAVKRAGETLLKFIKVSSDAIETANIFNVVFGKNADEARQWAATFSDSVGRGELAVQRWMSSLGDTFVPLGATREQALALSQIIAKTAVDVASFKNATDTEALEAFTSALVGNHRAVRKFGIVITEARLKEQALSQGITENVDDLGQLNKALLRMQIILHDSRDAQDDAVETAHTWANQIKRLEGNWEDLKKAIGDVFIERATEVLTRLNLGIEDMIENSDELQLRLNGILESLKQIGRLLKVVFPRHEVRQLRERGVFAKMANDMVKAANATKAAANTLAATGIVPDVKTPSQNKAIEKALKAASAREISAAFVSIPGLSIGITPETKELKKVVNQQQITNNLLGQIRNLQQPALQ
jgi:hypothetical protein